MQKKKRNKKNEKKPDMPTLMSTCRLNPPRRNVVSARLVFPKLWVGVVVMQVVVVEVALAVVVVSF